MSARQPFSPTPASARPTTRARSLSSALVRSALAGMLGLAVALLVSCGSSSDKLIPVADAGPLQSDFETVAQDAETGNGNCAVTERAILKTEQDFDALPGSLDNGLRETLRQGIDNLRARALALCAQPLAQTTSTSTTAKATTSTPTTTPTTTTPTTTPTSTAPTTTPTSTTPAGGTPAPGTGESPTGAPSGPGGGTGVGESGSPGAGAGTPESAAGANAGGGAQEGAK
jgi:hypothetical protein